MVAKMLKFTSSHSLGIALPEGYGKNWVNGLESLEKAGKIYFSAYICYRLTT